MAISNTTIQIKKSGAAGNAPSSLNFGELALNYYDGKLYYKNTTGNISYFYGANNGPSFATANANNNLILASTPNDTLSFLPANGITISACTTTKTITISDATTFSLATGAYAGANAAYAQANAAYAQANAASATSSAPAFTQANSAYAQANAAFSTANSSSNTATASYAAANAAFVQANSASAYANAINLTQNTSITAAFTQANAAFTAANSAIGSSAAAAFAQANAAFAKANTAFLTTGGTITGNVRVDANVSVNGTFSFANSTNANIVYTLYNSTSTSLDTYFG
jgi:hypothetical protein